MFCLRSGILEAESGASGMPKVHEDPGTSSHTSSSSVWHILNHGFDIATTNVILITWWGMACQSWWPPTTYFGCGPLFDHKTSTSWAPAELFVWNWVWLGSSSRHLLGCVNGCPQVLWHIICYGWKKGGLLDVLDESHLAQMCRWRCRRCCCMLSCSDLASQLLGKNTCHPWM